ncbi:MAG TPA: LptF/LptG family permease, partial [Phycisphaerales bacterium]|nr:LptF/LptG family permease [Phycisphaerales bacterium]
MIRVSRTRRIRRRFLSNGLLCVQACPGPVAPIPVPGLSRYDRASMTLLDRYIAKQYLFNIIALTVILFSFVVVIDASLNIDEFLQRAGDLAQQRGEEAPGAVRRWVVTLLLVVDFWWPKLLQLYSFLIGMILVGAMGFTFSQMSRNREFIAMMAAGVGLHRVMKPIVVVAGLFMVLQIVNTEILIPRIAPL